MSGFRQIIEKQVRLGVTNVFMNPTINSSNLVDITNKLADAAGLLPTGTPLPVTDFDTPTTLTGTYLGYLDGGVTVTPSLSFDKRKVGGSISTYKALINGEDVTVTGNLVLNQNLNLWTFLLPPGISESTHFFFGGAIEPSYHSMLIIMSNILNPNVVQCMLFFRGFFNPQTFKSGNLQQFEPMPMQFEVISGRSRVEGEENCLLPAGQRIGHIWWQNLVTGNLVSPQA